MLKNRKQDKVYWDKSKLETKLGAAKLTMKTNTWDRNMELNRNMQNMNVKNQKHEHEPEQ